MWFNGVPNSVLGTTKIATLIVWKDYNCQSWNHISTGSGYPEILYLNPSINNYRGLAPK